MTRFRPFPNSDSFLLNSFGRTARVTVWSSDCSQGEPCCILTVDMSRSDNDRPSVQNKRQPDVDWESGWSKKKLVTDQRSEQDERVPEETPQPQAAKPSFKAVGHIVMAMKRFQASLNPTYTYGKVADTTSSGSSGFVHPAQRVMKKSDSMNSDGNNKKSLSSRGNRTALLFKQLADVPQNK